MTLEEANKIIAEFMGWYKQYTERHPDAWNNSEGFRVKEGEWFSQSLDALVPVWEKLEFVDFRCTWVSNKYDFTLSLNHDYTVRARFIEEAACIATARAIKELE